MWVVVGFLYEVRLIGGWSWLEMSVVNGWLLDSYDGLATSFFGWHASSFTGEVVKTDPKIGHNRKYANMNKKTLLVGMAAGVGILGMQQAQAMQINWASVGNAQLVFKSAVGATAANFSFQHSTTTAPGFDFQVNGSSLGSAPNTQANANSSVGDYGLFTGSFALTALQETPGNVNLLGVHTETATITASVGAQVIIADKGYNAGLGLAAPANATHLFRGFVTFDTIVLVYTKGAATPSNPSGLTFLADGISANTPNVSNGGALGGTYTGTSADLLALASTPSNLSGTWSFNFKSLQTMMTSGSGALNKVANSGNFQSNATVPDGGMTLVLLGFALSGVVLMKRQLA